MYRAYVPGPDFMKKIMVSPTSPKEYTTREKIVPFFSSPHPYACKSAPLHPPNESDAVQCMQANPISVE